MVSVSVFVWLYLPMSNAYLRAVTQLTHPLRREHLHGHILWSTNEGTPLLLFRLQDHGDAEVDDLEGPILPDHHVGR